MWVFVSLSSAASHVSILFVPFFLDVFFSLLVVCFPFKLHYSPFADAPSCSSRVPLYSYILCAKNGKKHEVGNIISSFSVNVWRVWNLPGTPNVQFLKRTFGSVPSRRWLSYSITWLFHGFCGISVRVLYSLNSDSMTFQLFPPRTPLPWITDVISRTRRRRRSWVRSRRRRWWLSGWTWRWRRSLQPRTPWWGRRSYRNFLRVHSFLKILLLLDLYSPSFLRVLHSFWIKFFKSGRNKQMAVYTAVQQNSWPKIVWVKIVDIL